MSRKKYPGKSALDCQVCPIGTDKNAFANYRACPCLTNYTRRNRFGPCEPCPSIAIKCENEFQQVNAGFFWTWKWPNVTDWNENLQDYKTFAENIQKHDFTSTHTKYTFRGTMPKAYPCPLGKRSCSDAGIAPNCGQGYTGWLCTECYGSSSWKTSYFSGFQRCIPCPAPWKASLSYICLLFIVTALFIIIWKSTSNPANKRSILDSLLAQFKIVLAFYQVTGAMFEALGSVPWPEKLTHLGTVIEFLQFNLLKVFVKPSCYFETVKLTAHKEFVIAFSFIGVTCVTALLWYIVRLVYVRIKFGMWLLHGAYARDARMKCYLFTIVVLFVTYPSVCSVTLALLPPGCDKYYLDENNEYHVRRLRADYSIDCDTDKHKRYTLLAYSALVYVIGFPCFLLLLLWRHRNDIYEMKKVKDSSKYFDKCIQTSDDFQHVQVGPSNITPHDEFESNIIYSASNNNGYDRLEGNSPGKDMYPVWILFLCENYKAEYWYWEIIELTRKLLQISLLTMFGSDNSWYLAVTVAVSMVYLTSYSYCKPISAGFEHALQMTSLVVISLNLLIATSLVMSENETMEPSNNAVVAVSLLILNVGVLLAVAGKFSVIFGVEWGWGGLWSGVWVWMGWGVCVGGVCVWGVGVCVCLPVRSIFSCMFFCFCFFPFQPMHLNA